VPAQEAAVFYLERAAEMDDRPIRVVGHSKGGNLAAYAAACCSPKVQDRLEAVYSFDGPGMDPKIFESEGYHRVVDRIYSFVPQTSIVGMMMEYHRKYTVVKSGASGFAQHDPLTWQVYGPRFETLEKIDANAKTISDTLHDWLKQTRPEDRESMVETLFGILENTKATTVVGMMEDKIRSLTGMATGARDLDPASRRAVSKLVGLFLTLGFGNIAERVRQRYSESRSGEPKEKKKEEKPVQRPEQNPEEKPEQIPEQNPEGKPEQIPEQNPEQKPEQKPEQNPEQKPEQQPEQNPEEKPEQEQT